MSASKKLDTVPITKLRGTEKTYDTKHQLRFNSNNKTERDKTLSPNLVSESVHKACGGRGIAIQRLLEPTMPLQNKNISPNLDYSNTSIEMHYKQLRERKMTQVKEKREDKWTSRFSVEKSS